MFPSKSKNVVYIFLFWDPKRKWFHGCSIFPMYILLYFWIILVSDKIN